MKLIFCLECSDAIKCGDGGWRYCECTASAGRYLDGGRHAEISGPCFAVGVASPDLHEGVVKVLADVEGELVEGPDVQCWVFPKSYGRIRRVDA
jgi:hypothetical protein